MRFVIVAVLLIASSFNIFAQQTLVGKVVDSETGSPLPFVNVVYNEIGQGLTTSLDGKFEILTDKPIQQLKLSYMGYSPLTVNITPNNYKRQMIIGLIPIAYNINEVVVRPGVNPAHRIIREVYKNRNANNPERLAQFRYNSYNKMYFTFQRDSISTFRETEKDSIAESPIDSLQKKIDDFNNRQHIFLMESVTERNFKSPNNNIETVLASRVSGLKDPFFTFLATQFQSFSFYSELISLGGKHYLNPISAGSTSRYLFILEDTLYTQELDTLFNISFRPLRKRNFAALRGVMTVNSNGYAIQNVIAEPVEPPSPLFTLKIQQRYEHFNKTQWFPVELNTDLYLRMVNAQAQDTTTGKKIPVSILGVGSSYIKNIELDPKIKSRQFSHVELDFDPLSGERDEEFWMQYRTDTLSSQDKRTYVVIDSIGQAANLDNRLLFFETMMRGKITWGYFDFDLNKFLHYNRFEGYRLGVGIESNRRISTWFTAGGYYAYGFNDNEHKFGGLGKVTLNKKHQVSIEVSFKHDVREPGEFRFQKPYGLFNSDAFRDILIWRMDYVDKYSAQLNFRIFKHFFIGLTGSQTQFNTSSGYSFNHPNLSDPSKFTTTEIGTNLRFVWKESFMETPRGLIPLNFGHPVVWFNFHTGITSFGGDFSYQRFELRFDHQLNYRTIGRTNITLSGGLINGTIPTPLLYFAPGNMDKYPLDATNAFATMKLYEFTSDRFAYTFIRHNFGSLFWKTKSKIFKPQFTVVQNFAIGNYTPSNRYIFPNNPPKNLAKGFFESGLLINGLLSNPFYSIGVGGYYRWGSNANLTWQENIAIKITISSSV